MYAYNNNKPDIQICKIKLHKITKNNQCKKSTNAQKKAQKKALLSQARLFRDFIITNLFYCTTNIANDFHLCKYFAQKKAHASLRRLLSCNNK